MRAEIDGDQQGVSAALVVQHAGHELTMVCDPAEALALTLRARVPILATDAALAHACPADQELRPHTVRRWLDGVRPADSADGAGAGE